MLNENRFLGTFRGHNTRTNKVILLATKTLVESIIIILGTRVAYFSYVTLASGRAYIDKFPPFLLLFFSKMADEFKVCGVERRRHLSLLRTIRKC